jgi:hypothetical protein
MSFNKKQLKKDSPKKNAIDLKLKPIKKNPNYKYGFSQFQPGEGNLMLGAGFGNSKIGMGAMGMTPLDAENRKYFKGLVDANINYNVNPNLNFRLGVNDVIGGGFNPGLNAGIKLKFEEGGEYVDAELNDDDIEYYKNQGYLVEYLDGGDVSEKENKDAAWAAKIRGGLGPEYANYNDEQIRELYDKSPNKLMTKFGEDSYVAPELDEFTVTSETDKERRDAYLARAEKYFAEGPNVFDQTENKEWIKNWVKARNATGNFENQLGNGQMERGFKSLDEVKKIPREEMAKIQDEASYWQIAPPVGMYSPADQKYFVEPTLLQKLKGNSSKYTDVHEQGHVFDIGTSGLTGTYMEEIPETNIHKAIKNIPTKGGYETEEYLPAAEIYAELIKFRRKNKINPNKVFTEDDLPELRKKLKEENAYGLFKLDDIYGDKEILRLMNEVATINTPQENNLLNEGQLPTAQEGGSTEPEYMYLELDDAAIQQYKNGGWVVEEMPEYKEGGKVSEIWEKETGTPWSEARLQGFSDGSYASNIALRKRLMAGEFSNTLSVTVPTNTPTELVSEPVSIEPTIVNNSNFEIPNQIIPSAKQVTALNNDKGPEGLGGNPDFAKVYNPHTIKNPFENKVPNDNIEQDIQNAASFSEAFGIARKAYGPNYIFEYKGRSFGTNKKGEDFKPTNKILKKHKLDTPEVKKRIEQETKEVESPFFSKETIKLEPDGYESWEDVKLRKEEFNKQDNADKIIEYHKNSPSKENFVIVDKAKGLMHIYKPNGELLYSEAFDVNTGKNEGDNQTVTKPKDLDGDGRITNDGDRINGKFQPDWSAGNKSTGAGKYYISNIDRAGYGGLPILNMMNERQYDKFKETGEVDNVATSFHKGYISGDNTRRSNGCVRCTKPTLNALTNSLKNLSEVYILPDNDENKFVYENGQLNFKPKLDEGAPMTEDSLNYLNPKTGKKSNIPYYKDERGNWQKGQGINKTNKTLNYLPIKINTDREALKAWGDKNMSGGYDGTLMNANYDHFESEIEPFVNSLAENKQKIMEVAQINGDVYNEIAKMTLGIYGTESSFGDTHTSLNNFVKAARKSISSENSSPDYYTKYNTYGADGDDNSVGRTQYRWKWALEDAKKGGKELEVLKKVGITKNSDFIDPEKAALATAAILAYRYNTQLSPEQKKDIWNHLPGKWNTRKNYGDRVKDNSSLFSINQMTEEANKNRIDEIDKINKKRKEDALPANVQARYEASLKRKAELERIEAEKSPEQKASESKLRTYEYIPEAESLGNNMPTFEQYPQIDLTRPRNRGQKDTRSSTDLDLERKRDLFNARRQQAKQSTTIGRPASSLHLKNYRKYGGEIKPKDIFIEYLKRKKGI